MSAYRLSPEAAKDILLIREYTQKKWGSSQAVKYINEIENKCKELSENPQLGRERPEIKLGYRSINEGKHIIFYRCSHSDIDILRVLHTRMDFHNILK